MPVNYTARILCAARHCTLAFRGQCRVVAPRFRHFAHEADEADEADEGKDG